MHAADARRPWKPQVIAIDLGGQTPPNNAEAEEAVLASILVEHRALRAVRRMPRPLIASDFYSEANAKTFAAACSLDDAGQPVDVQTVAAWLKDRIVEAVDEHGARTESDSLRSTGGITRLASLLSGTPAVAHVTAHAKIVIEKSRMRAALETAQRISAEIHGDYGDANQFLAQARRRFAEASDVRGEQRGPASMRAAVDELAVELQEQWAGKREAWGLPLPWSDVNRVLHGLEIGTVTIVAGRTSEGKSLFAAQALINAAGRTYHGETIGAYVWTGEMSRAQWSRRGLVQMVNAAGVRLLADELRTGREGGEKDGPPLEAFKVASIDAARKTLGDLPIVIDDRSGLDIGELRLAIRDARERWDEQPIREGQRRTRLRLVLIDHLHLIRLSRERGSSKTEGLEDVANALLAIAKEEGVAVVVIAQYTKEGSRDDCPPQTGHLRDSAAVDQIAANIVHVCRPWFRMADKSTAAAAECRDRASVHITKGREGRVGALGLLFDDDALRFTDDPNRTNGG